MGNTSSKKILEKQTQIYLSYLFIILSLYDQMHAFLKNYINFLKVIYIRSNPILCWFNKLRK